MSLAPGLRPHWCRFLKPGTRLTLFKSEWDRDMRAIARKAEEGQITPDNFDQYVHLMTGYHHQAEEEVAKLKSILRAEIFLDHEPWRLVSYDDAFEWEDYHVFFERLATEGGATPEDVRVLSEMRELPVWFRIGSVLVQGRALMWARLVGCEVEEI